MAAVEDFARRDADALLVYFAGHGRRYTDIPDRDLHFAFTESRQRWGFSHLPFTVLQRVLRNARAGWKGLIVDACYSDNLHLGMDGPVRMEVHGVCALTATKSRDTTSAECAIPGYRSYTAFSGALFSIVDQGIAGAPATLTLRRIFPVLTKVLEDGHQRLPHMSEELSTETELAFCVNNAPPAEPVAASRGADLGGTPEQYARVVERTHADGRLDAATALVNDFCRARRPGEILLLALELRSATLDTYAETAIASTYGNGSEAQVCELVHRLHEPADIGAARLMDALLGRPGEVCVKVLAQLREQSCADCGAVVATLDELITERWPAERLPELFTALAG
jgi:hypothetical protein